MRFELRPHDGLQLRGFRCVRMVGKTRQKEAQVPLDEVVVSGRVVKFDQLDRGQITRECFRVGITHPRQGWDIELFIDEFSNLPLGVMRLFTGIERDLVEPCLDGAKNILFLRLEFADQPQGLPFRVGIRG